MSLQLQVIERLFARLNATYGRDFMSRYEGQDANAVKSSWAHELDGFDKALSSIAWALENLPERAPNVIEFRALCRRAPAVDTPRLPEPVADKAKVTSELAKLQPIRARSSAPIGSKDWAYALQRRHVACERLNMNQIRCYREALGLNRIAA